MSKSKKELSFAEEVEQSLRKKFRKNIWCKFTKAINEYELVKPGDRIAVCISGGKDSMLLAKLFQELKRHNKFDFEVKFLVMDPGYSPVNRQVIEENAKRLEIPIEVFESDIFESVFNIEKSPCYLCARMRRGYLYIFRTFRSAEVCDAEESASGSCTDQALYSGDGDWSGCTSGQNPCGRRKSRERTCCSRRYAAASCLREWR